MNLYSTIKFYDDKCLFLGERSTVNDRERRGSQMGGQLTTEAEILAKIANERWSCRGFRSDPVPHETIDQILDIARTAPSWCNTQPWHVDITEGADTDRFRAALRSHVGSRISEEPDFPFPEAYEGSYLDRRRASGWQLYQSLGIAKGDRVASAQELLKNFDLFGAPHVAVITTDNKLGVYGAVDCGLFVQTFLLAAHSHGVATIAQAAIASQSPFIREYFGLPDDRKVLLGVSFGFADESHPANGYRTPRQSKGEMVTWHRGA
jgi:nitroreductase